MTDETLPEGCIKFADGVHYFFEDRLEFDWVNLKYGDITYIESTDRNTSRGFAHYLIDKNGHCETLLCSDETFWFLVSKCPKARVCFRPCN